MLGFLSPRQSSGVYELLRKKYKELKEENETNQEDRDEDEPPAKKVKQTAISFLLGDDGSTSDPEQSEENELASFLKEKNCTF